jgi:hypothetical protein
MSSTRQAFLQAASAAADLLGTRELAARWEQPSALAQMSNGALAAHTMMQVVRVPEVLGEPEPGERPVGLLEHYQRVTWVGADLDDDINVVIRDSSATTADAGASGVSARVNEVVAGLPALLDSAPRHRAVPVPGWTWALDLDDFLITRMMEIVVHSDDLAVSLGVPTPEFPREVLSPVIDLLARLSARRHGPLALVRALSRTERAPQTIAAL